MGKKLVIVESPAKAKTINKLLGKEYIVTSSVGHVRDLPVRTLGVDVEDNFKPKYVLSKGKKKVIDALKRDAKACDAIYLAPDPDREGEAIAWHIREILAPDNKDKAFFRVQYNEITARAVREAFEHPGEIDMQRVDAQQARRVLDRIVGYTVSPMLWRRIQRGLSAGRVQSVALRLVCEREDEIDKFVPEAYWVMGARVRKVVAPLDPFEIKLVRINDEKAEVKSEDVSVNILKDLEGRPLKVEGIQTRTVSRKAPPPFITSTLQQAGSSYCSFSPKRTMAIAQHLYEGIDFGDGPAGLITYMRTDSVAVSRDAQEGCRAYIEKTYGERYVPEKPNVYKSRSGAQEAHEAIRPTDVALTPDRLKGRLEAADLRLYRLIWSRFVASQMAPAQIEQRTVKVDAVRPTEQDSQYTFQATASDILFPGYMKVSAANGKKSAKDDDEQVLPILKEGEPLQCLEWLSDRKETKPPPRFSEASLVRELESNGVGRPSTYAQTIATLQQRTYALNEKRMLVPTELGRRVNALLVETLGKLFDVTFTASMEEALDEIERGDKEWTRMLGEFYVDFEKWMEGTRLPPADTDQVARSLALLEGVQDWAPEVKRGKRTYSDQRFVESIVKQQAEGKREVSQRQLETLVKMAWRYKDQLPEAEEQLKAMGFGEMLAHPDMQPPLETTQQKLELATSLELNEETRDFVASLDSRVKGGRRLTPAQLNALHSVILSHASQIEDFESLREQWDLGAAAEDDKESGPLLAAMATVSEWKEPVQRGKRVFDDQKFYESLSQHFGNRGALSPRQRAALKRMMKRYREQIPTYDAIAETYGIEAKAK